MDLSLSLSRYTQVKARENNGTRVLLLGFPAGTLAATFSPKTTEMSKILTAQTLKQMFERRVLTC